MDNQTTQKSNHNTQKTIEQCQKVLGGIISNADMARHSTSVVVKYAKNSQVADLLAGQIEKYDDYVAKAKQLAKEHGIKIEMPSGISKFFVEKSIKMRFASWLSVTSLFAMAFSSL